MDNDTFILLTLTFSAFCWWFKIQLDENKDFVEDCAKKEKEREKQAERVRQLTNKKQGN
jgi:hypothetical protein